MSELRPIGGLKVTVAGLGCGTFGWTLDESQSRSIVRAARAAGINHFDTGDDYGGGRAEEWLGRELAACRDDAVIATKFGDNPLLPGVAPRDGGKLPGGHPRRVAQSVEGSLRRLKTDRIDLYWLHSHDPDTPIGETLEALDQLVRDGKVREIGCSNFSAQQIEEADSTARDLGLRPFAAVQNPYNLVAREEEYQVIPVASKLGLRLVPFWPAAGGLLTGKYRRGEPHPAGTRLTKDRFPFLDRFMERDVLETVWRLDDYARERGRTMLELALSWLAQNPLVASVISGATRPQHVAANAAATGSWKMTEQERAQVDAICGLLRGKSR